MQASNTVVYTQTHIRRHFSYLVHKFLNQILNGKSYFDYHSIVPSRSFSLRHITIYNKSDSVDVDTRTMQKKVDLVIPTLNLFIKQNLIPFFKFYSPFINLIICEVSSVGKEKEEAEEEVKVEHN